MFLPAKKWARYGLQLRMQGIGLLKLEGAGRGAFYRLGERGLKTDENG